MIQLNYSVEWLDDFLKKLWQLTFEKSLNKSIKKAILMVERNSKIETPVDTGMLRRSYDREFRNLEWEIRNYRQYWLYVHEGTKYQKKNPFFQRWIDKTDISNIFEQDLIDLLTDLTNE